MYTCEGTIPSSVWNGSRHKAVPATSTTASTFALDAVLPHTELIPVLKRRRLKALIPYHPDAWEARLQEAGLGQKYPHIVSGLHLGFIINFPHVVITQIPPNKDSINEFAEEFSRIVHNKIQKGHYIGLISQQGIKALIGPFQSSPFSIIPKPGHSSKYCNIQDYSFLINPSLNSLILQLILMLSQTFSL